MRYMTSAGQTSYVCNLHKLLWCLQGYYDTADSGFRDEEGYIAVMARTDDVINVAGHRLSTSALEEVLPWFTPIRRVVSF